MYYKLDENKNVIPCNLQEWGNQRKLMVQTNTKHVAEETIGDYWISTVWLGIDHGYYDDRKPLIFETMIRNKGKWENYCDRYSTWEEALEGHKRAVQWVNNGCKEDD